MKKKAASALCRKFKFYHLVKRSLCMAHTVSSRIIAGGDNVFFCTIGGDYSREGEYFRFCSMEVVP